MLPPHPFPLKELSGDIRKPTLEDLKQVFELRHLARCVEQMYHRLDRDVKWGNEIPTRELMGSGPDDDPAVMRECLHTSIYRVLLAGAVLTRPYLEPMFLAPPDLLYRLHRPTSSEPWLSAKDLKYLERFPVYRLEATDEEWEPVFGDLAQWLVDDAKTTATPLEFPPRLFSQRSYDTPRGLLTPEDRGCLQEVVFFLAAYEHMFDKFFNERPKYADDPENEEMDEDLLIPPPFPGDVRDVSTAMFGMFRPEKVSTPAKVEDASRSCLLNYPLGHYPRDNSVLPKVSPWNTDVRGLLTCIRDFSGRPNHRNGSPSPPPWLRFVEFVMRKFFDVGLRDDLFQSDHHWYVYNYTGAFLNCPVLFRDCCLTSWWDVTSAILSPYQTPALSFRRIDW